MFDFKPPYLGAAYYPESFPREEIDKDLDRAVAHGLNTLRIAEFAWSTMEPEEGKYDFSLFREVIDKCKKRGIAVVMCTPSATPPSWMEHRYPEIMMEVGVSKRTHGSRRMSCPTNKTFRHFCAKIVDAMAREFANDENIIGWQLDNEISTLPYGMGCTCPSCRQGFRDYLRRRYGTIEALNDAWEHCTWSLNFTSFDEIDAYDGYTSVPAVHQYAWEEYKNECYRDFLLDQVKILKKYVSVPIGTDMMPTHQFDIQAINDHLDVAQFNHYSGPGSARPWFELYRQSADRLWITETSTCWCGAQQPIFGDRAKGFCKANTLAPFALGGEMVCYWLFRAHRGGHEMAHGSVIDAWGRDMHISDEVRDISCDLDLLRPMVHGTKVECNGLAIVNGHRAYEIANRAPMTSSGNTIGDWTSDTIQTVYSPLNHRHYRPDMISMYHDLTPYKLLINYRTYTLDEGGFLDRIIPWVENGGTWVVGPFTDIFTKDLAKYKNAPYGHLEAWADIERKYTIPAPVGETATRIELSDGTILNTKPLTYDALIAGQNAKVLGKYSDGSNEYLVGNVAITETKLGKGRIIMMGAALDYDSFISFIGGIASEIGITPITEGDRGVATSILDGEYGRVFCAIETHAEPEKIKIPFASTDILTGRKYSAGETVEMDKYECIFAKKD